MTQAWSGRLRSAPLLFAFVLLLGGALGGARGVAAASARISFYKVYTPGWNLVAGPVGATLAPGTQPLTSLDGTSDNYTVQQDTTAQAGAGYWVFYPHGVVQLLIGTPQETTTIHLTGGQWATIGNSGSKPAAVRGADIALTYTADQGFQPANQVQPGQAALVFAYTDTDVALDPFLQTPTRQSILPPPEAPEPPAVPPLPITVTAPAIDTSTGNPAPSPVDELNYLYAITPVLGDVNTQIGDFADKIGSADPAQPSDPYWDALRADSAAIGSDLRTLNGLLAPPRYQAIQSDLLNALGDISDGMRESIAGALGGLPNEQNVGATLLASGARRLQIAVSRLPQ
jgi:hypothetical protein